ncbi:MAG: hypothetical protein AMK74_05665 [Nitrospira bacterium SM23_35]|nr:MAG: hypothetical protein AMK74_05665 [Nitrospira bacterium SM23_35]
MIAFEFGLFFDLQFSGKNKPDKTGGVTFLEDDCISRIRDRFKKTSDLSEVLFIQERERYLVPEFAEVAMC